MDIKKQILDHISVHGPSSGVAIAEMLGVSRQAVNRYMKALVEAGDLIKEGRTRGTLYRFSEDTDSTEGKTLRKRLLLAGMEEDRVFEEIGITLNLQSELSEQGYEIVRYAFTEILNNAIDHSGSTHGELVVEMQAYELSFSIRDFGVGIFQNIADTCNLPDEYAALGHLLKGKQTTMPERHSGEGLFFTSRIGDEVAIRSHALALSFLNSREDLITGEIPRLKGTDVSFTIKKQTKKSLQKLFERYAPEKYEYRFSRSRVQVKLYQRNYMSRSEGRRLVSGLHEFREIIFDFQGVASIGQAFSDEVFRLFPIRHPDILIEVEHANPAIVQMLKHVGVDN